MQITNIGLVPREPDDNPVFTGPVTRQSMVPDSDEFSINVINFSKGVRNKFHTHSQEQILIVTAGKGIVATEKEQRVVEKGDVVLIPAGEKHWHGATQDAEFSHLYVMQKAAVFKQLEE